MDGLAFDRSDEEITYMDTKDNVIYLAGGCFWGMEQLAMERLANMGRLFE